MTKNNNYRRISWMYKNSPTLESYIEQRLTKLNNNPIKVTKDETNSSRMVNGRNE
jgi:hypothetical protein